MTSSTPWRISPKASLVVALCDEFTYILDKPWFRGLSPQQKPRYQPVTYFTYWPFLGSFNNWNIITFSHKATTSEAFGDIRQGVLDVISENMASLVQSGNYFSINITDTSAMGYCVIKFVSEAYTLQDDTTCDGKISSVDELFVKAQYLNCMKENRNCCWGEKSINHSLLFQHALVYIHVLMMWQ